MVSRVLHVTDYYLPRLGGIEMHVSDLVAHQRLSGVEASVATTTVAGAVPDPATGQIRSIPNLVVPADTILVYVDGGPLATSAEAGEVVKQRLADLHESLGRFRKAALNGSGRSRRGSGAG